VTCGEGVAVVASMTSCLCVSPRMDALLCEGGGASWKVLGFQDCPSSSCQDDEGKLLLCGPAPKDLVMTSLAALQTPRQLQRVKTHCSHVDRGGCSLSSGDWTNVKLSRM